MTIRIVVDERERNSRVPELLKSMGVFVDYKQLLVGDYIVSSETIIERKTINDLISSVFDGRLFIQCSDLINHYAKPIIIVEGNLTDLDTREDFQSDSKLIVDKLRVAYETLIKIALDFRIPVLYTNSIFYTAELLVLLTSNQFRSKDSGPLLKKIKKSNPFFLQQLYVLTSLPGVGTKVATRLLDKFQSPRNVLNASIAELARIPGIGNIRAEKIRKILDSPISTETAAFTQKKLVIDSIDEEHDVHGKIAGDNNDNDNDNDNDNNNSNDLPGPQ
ncbi:ERCC4 domain-containing protein [Candidatus Nitrosocosmicus agrestis]|uniref:ERCC4 domain-containing protein n=1 Tax=Candidatus Nitrosocosmicus agrestis TaxID=2563600 RepID=UPI001E45DD78|nr:ERCC4 domain-containing protein [Candidatus Nitrosocosmicus sp. SS]